MSFHPVTLAGCTNVTHEQTTQW